MIPIFQEIIEPGTGDCFSACLATLLELSLSSVPKFRRDNPAPKDMMKAAREWAKERFNLSIITVQMAKELITGEDLRIVGAFAGTPCIAGGASPNFPDCFHAVVGEVDCLGNFTLTHDPNPSGKGIVGAPRHLYFLVPINPAVKTFKRNCQL